MKSSPYSLKLEKAHMQNEDTEQTKVKNLNKILKEYLQIFLIVE